MFSKQVTRFVFQSLCAAAFAAGVSALPTQMSAQQPYRVIDRWKIGGDDFWDYVRVDPAAHRLYVTRNTQVQVVDTTSGKVIGVVDGLKGAHGTVVDPIGKFGYISDGSAQAVVVFDTASFAKVGSIALDANPDGIVFEPVTKTVWTFNGRGGTASAIDSSTQKALVTISLGGGGEAPAIDGAGNIYGNVEGKIIRIDAKTKEITGRWDTGCTNANGLAIDPAGHRLFQACSGKKMAVVDSDTGKVLATAEIGDRPDGAGYSEKNHLAFASCGDGTLSAVDASVPGYPTIEKLETQSGARTMTYDPLTDRVYTVTAETKAPVGAPQEGPGGPGGSGGPTGPQGPRPRPSLVPGSFNVIVIGH